MPVMTPTAGAEGELSDEVGEQHSRAPTRAAGTSSDSATIRAAIGPPRKATKAIGPAAAVAKAISATADDAR